MSGPLPRHLLPDSSSVDADGQLLIAGLRATDLAAELGTPLFVYDEEHLRTRCREAVAGFGDGVAYAAKAFLCRAMAQLVHEEGMYIDVASGGELYVARSAGVPADRLVLHGNNKSIIELRQALREGVGRIVIDSFDELDRLDRLHGDGERVPDVLIRVTPGVDAQTHEFVATGQNDSKFGFTVSTGTAQIAVERAIASPSVNVVGVHAHVGSQVFRIESFFESVKIIGAFAAPLGLPELSIGGGLGVPYVEGEEAPSIPQWAAAVRRACESAGVTARVSAEPGRSIAAAAAITLYTVGTIKEIPGVRTYVSVDGGMSDNPRPVLYGSGYETFLPRSVDAARGRTVTVVGKHCESGDRLVVDASGRVDTAVGDILATPVTGAYGHSMGSNYNKILRPPVVFVRDGRATVVVRRERYEDLIRLDV
ncbi:MAG: diaminopimelate decarboxylase [Acidimicrobiia bacterium]|nr:diaminopimelate decarboxylase [Acidimicrobiia bacterium]